MKKYIQALHQRPAHHKRRISLHAAGIITAILFIGWLVTLGPRLSGEFAQNNMPTNQGLAAVAAAGSDVSSSFSQISGSTLIPVGGDSPQNTDASAQAQASTSAPATVLYGAPIDQTNTDTSEANQYGGYGSTQ